ncbi:hypothetical protein DIPPA_26066 [Diplonema papillatum]|nr:hypothetical protein DIPPA_26066 [Diplonema papillatum]
MTSTPPLEKHAGPRKAAASARVAFFSQELARFQASRPPGPASPRRAETRLISVAAKPCCVPDSAQYGVKLPNRPRATTHCTALIVVTGALAELSTEPVFGT